MKMTEYHLYACVSTIRMHVQLRTSHSSMQHAPWSSCSCTVTLTMHQSAAPQGRRPALSANSGYLRWCTGVPSHLRTLPGVGDTSYVNCHCSLVVCSWPNSINYLLPHQSQTIHSHGERHSHTQMPSQTTGHPTSRQSPWATQYNRQV